MKLSPKKGFTLIEVVIVLAIAALIMVIVFLAVQGAQRAQRDNNLKSLAGRTLAAAEQYSSNNSNNYPTNATTPANFVTYINAAAGFNPVPLSATNGQVLTNADTGKYYFGGGLKCTTGTGVPTTTGAASTNGVVIWWSEVASAQQCQSN